MGPPSEVSLDRLLVIGPDCFKHTDNTLEASRRRIVRRYLARVGIELLVLAAVAALI